MTRLNTSLWAFGLCLQMLLLALLVSRRLYRQLPAFTALSGFYLLRSLVLFPLFGHREDAGYTMLTDVCALLDLLLQVGVGWELFRAARSKRPGGLPLRMAGFAVFAALAAGFAWTLAVSVESNPHSPIQRGVVFTGGLMLMLGFSSVSMRFAAAARRVQEGMTILGGVSMLTQVERTLAAWHRNVAAYRAWYYVDAGMYLAVLLFWLVTLRSVTGRTKVRPSPYAEFFIALSSPPVKPSSEGVALLRPSERSRQG